MGDKRFCPGFSGILLAVLLTLSATAMAAGNAEKPADQLLKQGMRHYDKGEYEAARKAFTELIDLRPDSQTVLELRRQAELGELARIAGSEEDGVAEPARKILEMMNQTVRQLKRKVPHPERLVEAYRNPQLEPYLEARAEFLGHGAFSIPYMLDLLVAKGDESQRTVGRAISTLTDIGRVASPPLVAALQAENELLQRRIAASLGQIGDHRAIPALLLLVESQEEDSSLSKTAADAIKKIRGESPSELGSATQEYQALIRQYLREDEAEVGYVFGDWQALWSWNPEGERLAGSLSYELVPNFLFHLRRASHLSLRSLAVRAHNGELQALLCAAFARELARSRLYALEGQNSTMREYSRKRTEALQRRVPELCHYYDASVVGGGLQHTMRLEDASASLYLVEMMGQKVGLDSPAAARSLSAALGFGGKDVRYQASVEIVRASPIGTIGDPQRVIQVMSAALRRAAQQTALIVSNNLQFRNRLSNLLEEKDIFSVEANSNAGAIDNALKLQPAVDIVFLSANAQQKVFDSAYQKLRKDGRTRTVPLYVVVDKRKAAVDLAPYEEITRVLSPDHLHPKRLEPILGGAFRETRVLGAPEQAELVLQAARALNSVPPAATNYPLDMLEPSLARTVNADDESVSMAVVESLRRFGTANSLPALSRLLSTENASPELRAGACQGIAAIVERTGKVPGDTTMDLLWEKLTDENAEVRQSAAEALSVCPIAPERILKQVQSVMTVSLETDPAPQEAPTEGEKPVEEKPEEEKEPPAEKQPPKPKEEPEEEGAEEMEEFSF